MATAPTRPRTDQVPTTRGRLLPGVIMGILAAIAAAVVVWLVAVPLCGVELGTRQGRNIGIVAVLIVSMLSGAAGFGLLAWLARRHAGLRVWTILAALTLLVSLAGTLSGGTAAATITLLCFHLAVGITVITLGRVGVRRLR